jgi:hypothetical protein
LSGTSVRPSVQPAIAVAGNIPEVGSITPMRGALLVRWGQRTTPLGESAIAMPPCDQTALELVNEIRAKQDPHGRSLRGLMEPVFAEARTTG